jgi:hypothetical protein
VPGCHISRLEVLESRTSCRVLELDAGDGVGTLKTCVRCGKVGLGAVDILSELHGPQETRWKYQRAT